MKSDLVFSTLWKLALCTFVFIIGLVINGMISPLLGIDSFFQELGTDGKMTVFSLVIFSILFAVVVSEIFRNVQIPWFFRVMIIFELIWLLELGGMGIRLLFFLSSRSLFSVITSVVVLIHLLLPNLLLCGLVVILFPPKNSQWIRSRVKPQNWRVAFLGLESPF